MKELLKQEKGKSPQTREYTLVKKGGPEIQFNTEVSPYFSAGILVTLMDLVNAQVFAEVTNQGFTFDLAFSEGSIGDLTLSCILKNDIDFTGSASFSFGIDHEFGPIEIEGYDLGSIHLEAEFNGDLSLTISPSDFIMVVDGSFDFEGATITFPTLTINVPLDSIGQLPSKIISQIDYE